MPCLKKIATHRITTEAVIAYFAPTITLLFPVPAPDLASDLAGRPLAVHCVDRVRASESVSYWLIGYRTWREGIVDILIDFWLPYPSWENQISIDISRLVLHLLDCENLGFTDVLSRWAIRLICSGFAVLKWKVHYCYSSSNKYLSIDAQLIGDWFQIIDWFLATVILRHVNEFSGNLHIEGEESKHFG